MELPVSAIMLCLSLLCLASSFRNSSCINGWFFLLQSNNYSMRKPVCLSLQDHFQCLAVCIDTDHLCTGSFEEHVLSFLLDV